MSTIRLHLRADKSGKRSTSTVMEASAAFGPTLEQSVNTYVIKRGDTVTITAKNGIAFCMSRPFKFTVTPTTAGDTGAITVSSLEMGIFMFACTVLIDYLDADPIDLNLEVTATLF